MVSLDSLVQDSHVYRKFNQMRSFKNTETKLRKFEKNNAHKGYGLLRLFKCLLLQFIEYLSDRELEKFLRENTSENCFVVLHSQVRPRITVYSQKYENV